MPTLLTNAHVSIGRAAIVTSVMQGGGVVGGLLLMRPVDRLGMLPITLVFALGIPSVGVIGFIDNYPDLLAVAAFLVGAAAVGGLLSVHSIAASFYPTSVRSTGMGWALGIGRFGAVLGPLVGGLLIFLKLTMQQLFLVAMVPFILVTIASYLLSRMHAARLATERVGTPSAAIAVTAEPYG
jgi:MFS transporter, AAHS family, 4-hydroxybenzoate transporter